MATVAIGIAFSSGGAFASAGVVTQLVATLAASYIDSAFVTPALMKSGAPKLGDMSISRAEEGSPHNYGISTFNRMPGFMAWAPAEYEVTVEDIGKGGPQGTKNTYRTTPIWLFARTIGIPVFDIPKTWLNGNLKYSRTAEALRATFLPGIQDISITRAEFQTGIQVQMLIVTLDASFFDLREFQTGIHAVIVGCADAVNNGDFRVISTGQNPSTGRTWMYLKNANCVSVGAAGSAAAPDPSVGAHVIVQHAPSFSEGLADTVSLKKGSRSHNVFPLIEAEEGVGQVPHFQSFALQLWLRLKLYDFANRVPSAEAQVAFSPHPLTIGAGIREILLRYLEIGSSEIDTTLLDGYEGDADLVHGYWWSAPYDSEILQPLIIAFDLVLAEVDTVLHIYKRKDAPVHIVDPADLGAMESGSSDSSPMDVFDADDSEYPGYVSVTFRDVDAEMATGTLQCRRPDIPSNPTVNVNLENLTLTSQQARNIANRMLFEKTSNRQELELTLPPKYAHVTEGCYLLITVQGKTWRMFVKTVRRGAQGLRICSGFNDPLYARELQDIAVEAGGYQSGGIGDQYFPPELVPFILDIPPLNDTTAQGPYLLMGGSAQYYTAVWQGAVFYEERHGSPGYGQAGQISIETVSGFTTTVMPDGLPGFMNTSGSVKITLIHGELFTINQEQLLDGFNTCYINGELFGYLNAELSTDPEDEDNTYIMSSFLRGLRGTESRVAPHPIGSHFVFVRTQTMLERIMPTFDIGSTFNYKLLPSNALLDSVDAVEHTLQGNSMRPFEVGHLTGYALRQVGTTGANVIITWQRRSRMLLKALALPSGPFAEASEDYIINIYAGTSTTVVRSLPLTQARYIYSNTQRVADGNTGDFNVGVICVGSRVNSLEAIVQLPNIT